MSAAGKLQSTEHPSCAATLLNTTTETQPHPAISTLSKPPTKMPKLLSKYSRESTTATVSRPLLSTPLSEYHKYVALCAELRVKQDVGDADEVNLELDCLQFWHKKQNELPTLFKLAMKVHSVPATSAPVERIFSHGGIVMRPHRARMADQTLSDLLLVKCND